MLPFSPGKYHLTPRKRSAKSRAPKYVWPDIVSASADVFIEKPSLGSEASAARTTFSDWPPFAASPGFSTAGSLPTVFANTSRRSSTAFLSRFASPVTMANLSSPPSTSRSAAPAGAAFSLIGVSAFVWMS